MSVVFVPKKQRGKAQINQEVIQRLLDENDQLVRCITEYLQKGRATECVQYQQILHRNIVYLGTIADASPDVPSAVPASCDNGGGAAVIRPGPSGDPKNGSPSNPPTQLVPGINPGQEVGPLQGTYSRPFGERGETRTDAGRTCELHTG